MGWGFGMGEGKGGEHGKGNATYDDLLKTCWAIQECWDCLGEKTAPCSWCPVSSTCIPNLSSPQILAPIWNPDICPLWSERWEVRTKALGCHVSTITFLTAMGCILGTFLAVGLGYLVGKVGGDVWRRRGERWWRVWEWTLVLVDLNARGRNGDWVRGREVDEERPLLATPEG